MLLFYSQIIDQNVGISCEIYPPKKIFGDWGKCDFDVLLYAEKFGPNVYYRSKEISATILKIFKKLWEIW